MDKISKKEILISVAIICIIAIIIILVSFFGTKNNDKPASDINPYTDEKYISEKEMQEKIENMELYENLDIVVENLYDFVKVYKGDLATKDYTEYIKNLNNNLNELYSKTASLTSAEQDKYFEDNEEEIKSKYGIEKITVFDELLEYISIYENSNLQYKKVSLQKDAVEDETEYVRTKVNITYSNDITKTIFISVLKDTTTGKPEFVISF